jgi:hypothetical protein
MNIKRIKQNNPKEFINDLKSVREVMIKATQTGIFLQVRKIDLVSEAENRKINYYMTDEIFVRKRNVMIVI